MIMNISFALPSSPTKLVRINKFMPIISTGRVYLKRLEVVSNNYFENLTDPTSTEFLEAGALCVTKNDLRQYVKQKRKNRDYLFGVYLKRGNVHVGNSLLSKFNPVTRSAEIGMMIFKKFSGKGYGTETLKAVCDFAFQRLNLHKLKLYVVAGNKPAERLYEKLGFSEEGYLKHEFFGTGRYWDLRILSRFSPNGQMPDRKAS